MSQGLLLLSDWLEEQNHLNQLCEQHLALLDFRLDQLTHPSVFLERFAPQRDRRLRPAPLNYRPWGELLRNSNKGGTSTVKADKDKFQVILDVQQFKPDEINVKVLDKCVVVEAKHEEKQDEHGWISRQFVRKYMIPKQCDIDQVSSNLSLDGVLTIIAPRKEKLETKNERSIKIEHTGKPAIREKAAEKKKEEEKG